MMIIPAAASVRKLNVFKWFLLCTCVLVMYIQWTHIWMLRSEMAEIKHRFRPRDVSEMDGGMCCACCGCKMNGYHRFKETNTHPDIRNKRDVTEEKKQRQRRHTEHHPFLHLVPVSTQSNKDEDTTVLSWAVGRSRGNGLQVSGDTVTVVTEGTYFIYSQVLHKHTTCVMGHVITKKLKGAESKLMKCLRSMSINVTNPLNTCYTAGIHFLESGSTLQLSVPRTSAELILTAHATFMGILNI
ncbi:tumor necrosis factor ligand superfamily member 13 isoform X1 [Paramisgurnus dabryanus]|uniref:tumor necrosis factor ligand superfamily member 13 isoform X1 n=1 Tax=Paramisgurnus dabryanus TaxID=90735 RepID=UPI0031F44B13